MEERAGTILKLSLAEKIDQDFHAMMPWLPTRVSSILDIGCGRGNIDDYLIRFYGGDGVGGTSISMHLMDGDAIRPGNKIRTGYQQTTVPWGDRNIAVRRIERLFPACHVYGHPADPTLTIPCDLIVSRRAWGHHFSIATYIGLAARSLRRGGRIITDIRLDRGRDTDSLGAFQSYGFRVLSWNIEVRSKKCRRVVLGR